MKNINKKIILIIFGIVLISGNFVIAQAESEKVEKKKLTRLEHARKISRIKGSRKIDIRPIRQDKGIKTGCVIAYGHFMKPPFEVKYVDHKLMINGVQVEPSIVLERERKNRKPMESGYLKIVQRRMDVSKEIRKKYQEEKTYKSEVQLQRDILAFAKSKDVVLDAKWKNNAFMISFASGTGFGFMTLDKPRKPEGWKPRSRKKVIHEAEQSTLKGIKSALELDRGECLMFGSDLARMSLYDPRVIVGEIMKDPKLPTEEDKIEALQKKVFRGLYEGAFDVIENYIPEEWKVEK